MIRYSFVSLIWYSYLSDSVQISTILQYTSTSESDESGRQVIIRWSYSEIELKGNTRRSEISIATTSFLHHSAPCHNSTCSSVQLGFKLRRVSQHCSIAVCRWRYRTFWMGAGRVLYYAASIELFSNQLSRSRADELMKTHEWHNNNTRLPIAERWLKAPVTKP